MISFSVSRTTMDYSLLCLHFFLSKRKVCFHMKGPGGRASSRADAIRRNKSPCHFSDSLTHLQLHGQLAFLSRKSKKGLTQLSNRASLEVGVPRGVHGYLLRPHGPQHLSTQCGVDARSLSSFTARAEFLGAVGPLFPPQPTHAGSVASSSAIVLAVPSDVVRCGAWSIEAPLAQTCR
jgi:hypothetical protein